MKRWIVLGLLLCLLLSSCASPGEQMGKTAGERQTQGLTREEAWLRGENEVTLSRKIVRSKLLPLLYGESAPPLAEPSPVAAEEYEKMKGKHATELLSRFGLPYDLGDSPTELRYLSQEGHDVWVFLSSGEKVDEFGRVLQVKVNTREEAESVFARLYPDQSPTKTLWILRSYGVSDLQSTKMEDYVSRYGLPFTLKKTPQGYLWYYLADMKNRLVLEVEEENGALVIRSKATKKVGEEELLPLRENLYPILRELSSYREGRILSQEKTGEYLQKLYWGEESLPYETLPTPKKKEEYLALAAEGSTLEEMLSRFGVPYDVKGEEKEGELRFRYFTEEGNDVVVILRDYGKGLRVERVRVHQRDEIHKLLQSSHPQMKPLSALPSIVSEEDALADQKPISWLERYGAPYLESGGITINILQTDYVLYGYYLSIWGEKIPVQIRLLREELIVSPY